MSNPQNYTVGWICAITTEFVAAQAFLDEKHESPAEVAHNDNNYYALGRVGNHNVTIAVLPDGEYGMAPAAIVARDMLYTFPNIRIGLMVGIGGGAPSQKHDVRLGDVVVSSPHDGKGGVFQYDFGKTIQDQDFRETGFLNQPPLVLRTAVAVLKGKYELDGHHLLDDISDALQKRPRLRKKYSRPPVESDRLYISDFTHQGVYQDCGELCGDDVSTLVSRRPRDEDEDDPTIHYGLIASANQLMKDAQIRDKLAADKGVLCFEMEAAGLMNHFPCLVIRGICDYADSHKSKEWQGFAAMAAAGYAKDILLQILPNKVELERKISEVLFNIQQDLDQVQQISRDTNTHVREMKANSHYIHIKRWLSPADPSTNVNKARKSRHLGTGTWFLESKSFIDWRLGSCQCLWLYGMPGCGKTVLSATILEHLEEMSDCITLTFFFDFTDIRKQRLDHMLYSFAFQLYSLLPESRMELDSLFAYYSSGQRQPDINKLSRCLKDMMLTSNKVFILLDALDECSERVALLTWMEEFISTLPHIYLIATSRPEDELKRSLRLWIKNKNCIPLNKDSVNADIQAYIQARLSKGLDFERWARRRDVLDKIQDTISSKADGMFRWATCQLDILSHCRDIGTIKDTLESLPPDLNHTYDRILQNIRPEYKEKTTRLLQFLVCSKRPLKLEEAVDVIAFRPDGGHFDSDYRLENPEEITAYSSSLILLTPASYPEGSPTLQLAHFSVKEYLIGANYTDIMAAVTQTCLIYLGDIHVDRVSTLRKRFPLAQFAASYWMDFAQQSDNVAETLNMIINFLQKKESFLLWASLFNPDKPWDKNPHIPKASPLYYACLKGLKTTVWKLLLNSKYINAQGGRYGNALQAASYGGHREIVQLLLDKEVDVNMQGGFFGNALQAASARGHREIIHLLLEKGADINTQCGRYGNALQAASYRGNQEVMQLLLDNGADVNMQGGLFGNALQAASFRGHREIVQLLLDRGVDVNTQCGRYGNALQAASYGGHQGIVQLLLDKEADVNMQGGLFSNALQAASARGHREIIHLLLDKGADVNIQGGLYGNTLQAALEEGYQEIIHLLLDKEVDVNMQGGEYRNALQAASYRGHQEIVQLLLDKEADINTQCGRYGNALQAASYRGNQEVMQLLLDNGADVNMQGGLFGNALQAASFRGHREIVQLLLNHGADPAIADESGRTPLHVACALGKLNVVKALLEYNKYLSTKQDNCERTALFDAAQYGQHKIVEILLATGLTHPDTTDCYSSTPLFIATRNGHVMTVEILLSYSNIHLELKDVFGHSLICWAEWFDNAELIDCLLQHAKPSAVQNNPEDSCAIGRDRAVFNATSNMCNACTLGVGSVYYHCQICNCGDFDICMDCFKFGLTCIDDSHTLILQRSVENVKSRQR